MCTNVVYFRVISRLCSREWNWLWNNWNWRCVNQHSWDPWQWTTWSRRVTSDFNSVLMYHRNFIWNRALVLLLDPIPYNCVTNDKLVTIADTSYWNHHYRLKSMFPTLWGWTVHFLDGSPPCCPVSWVNVGNVRRSSVFTALNWRSADLSKILAFAIGISALAPFHKNLLWWQQLYLDGNFQ